MVKSILNVVLTVLQAIVAFQNTRMRSQDRKEAGDARDAHRLNEAEEQEDRAKTIRLQHRADRAKRLPEQQ